MTARAHVEHDFMRDQLTINVGRKMPDGFIEQWMFAPATIVRGGEAVGPAEPSLRMPEDIARALMEALERHFQLASSDALLRRDYEEERRRVDKLIDATIKVAAGG